MQQEVDFEQIQEQLLVFSEAALKAPATPAWEKHHREGKTNEITGRFFRPRVPEEFYDNKKDFDDLPDYLREGLDVHFVKTYPEVYKIAFGN